LTGTKDSFTYDDKGNMIQEIKRKSDGSLDWKYSYNYDDKGNKIEAYEYSILDEPISKTEYIYSK
jgi:hypothetical protein